MKKEENIDINLISEDEKIKKEKNEKEDIVNNSIIKKLSSGNYDLDIFLEGGYEKDIITTIYGPSGSGKTTLAIIASINVARSNKKIIYIDSEASFSVDRLKQIAGKDYEEILSKMLFLKPINFQEQQKAFEKLKQLVNESIGLIVIDTISMLYRLEIGQTKDIYDVNKKLGIQLSFLSEITRKKNIPVIVNNQVYSNFDEKDKVNIVGGDILKYSSKTLIELQCLKNSVRCMIVRKSRFIPEDKTFFFKLIDKGIEKFEKII